MLLPFYSGHLKNHWKRTVLCPTRWQEIGKASDSEATHAAECTPLPSQLHFWDYPLSFVFHWLLWGLFVFFFQCIVLYSTEPKVLLTDKGLFRKPGQGHFPGSKTTVRPWLPNCRIFARAAAPWTARCPAEGSWYPWDGQVTPPQTSWNAGAQERGWLWDLLTVSGGTGWSRGGLLNSSTFHFNAQERRAGFSHERTGTCQCCRSCF